MLDVAVIGGGVSGLATAFDLIRRGHRVAVLERQVRPGGNAISERFGGFLMEHGPSTVASASAVAGEFSRRLDLGGERCGLGDGVRRRYLVGDGSLRGIAIHPLGFILSGHLSLKARMRMIAEFAVPRGGGEREETVAEFCARRFGSEFVERVVDPLVGGMYAGRADEVAVGAVFPQLVRLEREYGSVAFGMLRRRWQGGRMPGSRLFSWRHGIGSLPCALAARLNGVLHTGVTVRRVEAVSGGFRVDAGAAGAVTARALVIATQPHVAARLLDGVDAAAAAAAADIDAPPLAVVFLGYECRQVAHPLDGLGFLVPQREGRAITGAQFCSTMFPGRAPEGCVAVAGYFGGARAPDLARLPAADLIALAEGEFRELIGARGAPVVARVRHWPMGLPQYRIGHRRRTAALREAERRRPGLFATGNYFAGPSVAACLEQAGETSARADAFLLGARGDRERLRAVSGGLTDVKERVPRAP